jgi:hypothetical protein
MLKLFMLQCRSGSRLFRGTRLSFVFLLVGSCLACCRGWQTPQGAPTPTPDASKEDLGLKNIPLTVGHEAKGWSCPISISGASLGRFEADSAARIDENHVHFTNLKMLTFNKQQKPDFNVNMTDATLNLETRVIDSKRRTMIKRTDFEIAGDTMSSTL